MSSETETLHLRVYMPYGPDAQTLRIKVSLPAFVEDLVDEIRKHVDLKDHTSKAFQLYKYNRTVSPPDRFKSVTDWLFLSERSQDLLDNGTPLSVYHLRGGADIMHFIDVVIAPGTPFHFLVFVPFHADAQPVRVSVSRDADVYEFEAKIRKHEDLKDHIFGTLKVYICRERVPYVGRFKYIKTWLDSRTEENLLGPGRLIHHFPQGPLDKDDTIDFVAVPNFAPQLLSTQIPAEQRDAIVKSLPRLERFHRAMWGRDVATIRHTFELYSGEKTLAYKYLDLSEFLDDLRPLWDDLVSPLLIREEYEQVYTVLSDASRSHRAGWVITGQPGIGKTMFLFYILINRLSICQPVAIETEAGYYFLFTETGVEALSAKLFDMGQSSRIWALSNSSRLLNKPSQALMASPKKEVYLLHTSSPQESHWKEWAKERGAGIHEMDVWQPDELLALEKLLTMPSRVRLPKLRANEDSVHET